MELILEHVDRYQQLLEERDRLKAETEENNKLLQAEKEALSQVMIEEEVPKISRGGFSFILQSKTKYSKKAGCDQQLFEVLRDEGLGDIIRETVNAQTLQGTISSLVEERGELPPEFEEFISVYDHYDVMRRKETNRAAVAAKSK